MQRYNINNRLAYLSGGVQSAGGMWPSLSDGWWDIAGETCLAAYQPKGAASLAASYVNLANPGTYDAAPGSAPSFDTSTGWTFNGSTNYLDTSVSDSDVSSVVIRFSDAGTTGDKYIIGTNNANIAATFNNGNEVRYKYSGSTTVAPRATSGVLATCGGTGYRDGSSDGTFSYSAGSGFPFFIGGISIWVGSWALYGGASVKVQAVALYSTTLDSTQISDLTDAMNAL